MTKVPQTMRALSLPAQDSDLHVAVRSLRVVERPVPKPRSGEVLIQILAAPCNPSDLMHLQGRYGVEKAMPSVPGWEGAGRVVASGGGLMGRLLVGRTVACGGQGDFDGTWAEYYVARATQCIPLLDGLDPVQGSTLIVNPVSALAMLDTARRELRSPAVINLAAASQLGRMVVALAHADGYPVINVVRREAQADLVREHGGEHVLVSDAEDYEERLRALAHRLDARVAFDPIGGATTGQVLGAMPKGAHVLVYGSLAGEPCSGIDALGLIFEDKHVRGFWLTEWLERQNLLGLVQKTRALQKGMIGGLVRTEVKAKVGFDGFVDAALGYVDDMTAGKVILVP